MAAEENYYASLIDNSDSEELSSTRILGVRLRKFCLWHRLILNAMESPFMETGEVGMRDLRNAVAACRLRFGESRLRRPWLVPCLLYAWAVVCAIASLPLFWRKRKPGALNPIQRALKKRVEAFLSHCGNYLLSPEFGIIPPEGRHSHRDRGRLPDEIEHAADLMASPGLRIPEKRAWEMPLGLANHYRPICWRLRGVDVSFVTPKEEAFLATLPPEFRTDYKPPGDN